MEAYLDNSATTRVCGPAARTALEVMCTDYGNPSSMHAKGRRALEILNAARESVASAAGAAPGEITFTSGGTEADNLAIFSAARLMRHRGKHIISTEIEHDAVLKSLETLKARGWEVTLLKPGKSGRVSISDLEQSLRGDTALVSMMLVNNETGAVQPVGEAAKLIKSRGLGTLLHTDAVQGLFKLPFTVRDLGVDLLTISSHKVHGSKGAGALYVKRGVRLAPRMYGGGQEGSLRSGTEGLPQIAAFGEACRVSMETQSGDIARMRQLRDSLSERLVGTVEGLEIIGPGDAPHILCISLPGYRGEVVLNYLDARGVFVSRGSACKKNHRSHVLTAMGLSPRVIDGSIRISLSRETTREETDYAAAQIASARAELLPSL